MPAFLRQKGLQGRSRRLIEKYFRATRNSHFNRLLWAGWLVDGTDAYRSVSFDFVRPYDAVPCSKRPEIRAACTGAV